MLYAAVVGLASGVFSRSLFVFPLAAYAFIGLLVAILLLVRFFVPRTLSTLVLIVVAFFMLGLVRTAVEDTQPPPTFMQDLHTRVSYEGVVVSDPDVRDSTQRVAVRVQKAGEQTTVLVVANRNAAVSIGDTVSVYGTLTLPKAFSSVEEEGRVFRYDAYLQKDGIRFLISFASLYVREPAPWYSVPAALAHLKHFFVNGISAVLPEPYASLAGGIVIGGKSGLGSELQNDFIRSGLIPIIVLSGYNVMIVAEWVLLLFASLKWSRRVSAIAGGAALLLFVGVAGFSATALRAAVMALIALFARATGKSYSAGRALFVAVFLMLLWNPLYLVFDPGFDLSVAATAGLIWLSPIAEVWLIKIKNTFWRTTIATTLAAQIAVLPLLLYDMGIFSAVAVPANLLALPVVPFAMAFSACAGIVGAFFAPVAPVFVIALALPAYVLNAYLIGLAKAASSFPLAAFVLPAFPFWIVALAYAVLIGSYFAFRNRSSTTLQLRLLKNAST